MIQPSEHLKAQEIYKINQIDKLFYVTSSKEQYLKLGFKESLNEYEIRKHQKINLYEIALISRLRNMIYLKIQLLNFQLVNSQI